MGKTSGETEELGINLLWQGGTKEVGHAVQRRGKPHGRKQISKQISDGGLGSQVFQSEVWRTTLLRLIQNLS